jgi:hypothetical protein
MKITKTRIRTKMPIMMQIGNKTRIMITDMIRIRTTLITKLTIKSNKFMTKTVTRIIKITIKTMIIIMNIKVTMMNKAIGLIMNKIIIRNTMTIKMSIMELRRI